MIESILATLETIEKKQILPTNFSQKILRQHSEFNQFDSEFSYFPLEWFDCDNNDEFLANTHSTEGIAFLPTIATSTSSFQINPNDFEWRQVNIIRYNETTHKWYVAESGTIYEVPRIYLMFITEDHMKFIQRLQSAIQLRNNSECYLRFEAFLDGFEMEKFPQPSSAIHKRIRKLLERQCTKQQCEEWIEFYQREYTIVYQKFHAVMYLEKFIKEQRKSKSSSSKLGIQIQLPTRQERKLKNLLHSTITTSTLMQKQQQSWGRNEIMMEVEKKKSRRDIQQLWLYCCPQSIKIMEFIVDECEHVGDGAGYGMSLFHLQTTPCTLENFFQLNRMRMLSMSNFLQAEWIERIVDEIRRQLASTGGWYDLNVKSWEIFKMSKLHRLFKMIKVRMEVAVMLLLKSSLSAFVNHLCQPCECLLHVPIDFKWNKDDLTNSPFQPSSTYTNSIFHMYLHIDDDKPTFSTSSMLLDTLEHDIVNMFIERILTTHQIPQIDSHLITHLKFDVKNLMLSSTIGILNEDVQIQILHLRHCIRKCLIPLNEYAHQYHRYVPLMQFNIEKFVNDEKFLEAKTISNEIKAQEKLQGDLKAQIPENINIGPFFVDVAELKSKLIEKRDKIINALKQKLLDTVNEKLSTLQFNYETIYKKITERSPTVEHLNDIINYIPSIPSQIKKLAIEMKALLSDFHIIDSFLIIQPDNLFALKWKSLQMPQIITNSANEKLAQQEQEIVRFRKMQASDETVFVERLQIIFDEVNAGIKKFSFDDVTAAKNSFDKIWKLLTDTRDRGELLNSRWRILNQYKPAVIDEEEAEEVDVDREIDMKQLNIEVERLYPFYKFWTMTSNFLLSKEVWTRTPFMELQIDDMLEEMRQYDKEIIMTSHEFFKSENDSKTLNRQYNEMMKCIEIASDLINFRHEHWLRLNAKFNVSSLNYSTSTITDLMMRGIPSNIAKIVKELFLEAQRDATREREEKIQAEKDEKERLKREEKLLKQKQRRRAKRPDLFN